MQIAIDNITIGENAPAFIVAELSANHNNDIEVAKKSIIAIKETGADAVKVQSFLPEDMTLDLDLPMFMTRKDTIWKGRKLFDLYKEASMPFEWHEPLKKLANDLGLVFFSSPFSKSSVDFLEELQVPIYKIASPEITDIPLIEYVASKGKPIILSTGISTMSDIEMAVNTCRKAGNHQIIVLKCTTAYPTPLEEVNLRTLANIGETFNVIPGLSDHTIGATVSVVSVALGAKLIEKHFILDKKLGGPDASFSMEFNDFKNMVSSIKDAEKALGEINYNLTEKTKRSRLAARSLYFVRDIKKGEIIKEENLKSLRPGYGLHPQYLNTIIGKKASMDISLGTPVSWELIESNN